MVCADTTLTLLQKLATGKVYEHSGPSIEQAGHAVGRIADTAFVRRFTALECVGYTDKWDEALDRLCKLTPLFVFPCVEHI
jgi:hypothetical protein